MKIMSSCFSTTIDLSLEKKLRSDLNEQGFSFSTPPYTLFSAKKKGISCTLYQSGKLTVQGKEKDDFITYYLEPQILKNLSYSYPEINADFTPRIGMDEAGKGDFFGPLCVAALYADKEGVEALLKLKVKDSKNLSDEKVLDLAKRLKSQFSHTTIRLFPQKYNELYAQFKNLNHLLAWAHSAALSDLSEKTHCKVAILDKFAHESLVERFLKKKQTMVQLTQKVRAEEDPVVAAASILARAAFLEGMLTLCEEYDFVLPKGASKMTITAAQKLVTKHGSQVLQRVAKTHFKTMESLKC